MFSIRPLSSIVALCGSQFKREQFVSRWQRTGFTAEAEMGQVSANAQLYQLPADKVAVRQVVALTGREFAGPHAEFDCDLVRLGIVVSFVVVQDMPDHDQQSTRNGYDGLACLAAARLAGMRLASRSYSAFQCG